MGDEAQPLTSDIVTCNTLNILNVSNKIQEPSLHLKNGYIDRTQIVEFWDDFIGSNGVTNATVPGSPWSTLGSDAGFILESKSGHGGVWELKVETTDNNQMNLFAGGNSTSEGGAFTLSTNKSIHFKARFRRTHSGTDDHGFFIGLTSHGGADFIDNNCQAFNDTGSHYGLLMLYDYNTKKYTAVGFNNGTYARNEIGGAGMDESGYWPSDKDQLESVAPTAANPGWIVFEMDINHNNIGDTFTLDYRLTHDSQQYDTGTMTFDSDDLEDNSCKSTGQKFLSPAICIKRGTASANEISYEVDYIHCVQKR